MDAISNADVFKYDVFFITNNINRLTNFFVAGSRGREGTSWRFSHNVAAEGRSGTSGPQGLRRSIF
jgi:hypothetical protein